MIFPLGFLDASTPPHPGDFGTSHFLVQLSTGYSTSLECKRGYLPALRGALQSLVLNVRNRDAADKFELVINLKTAMMEFGR